MVTDLWMLMHILPGSGSADSYRFCQTHTSVFAQPQCSSPLLRMEAFSLIGLAYYEMFPIISPNIRRNISGLLVWNT